MKVRRHRRRQCAGAMVIDLGWSRKNWSRTAIAWSDQRTGRVKVDLLGPDDWIEDWVRDLLIPGGIVGLDIPVDGCAGDGEEGAFRHVDRAMIKTGIPLLPSVRAGSFGREVAGRVQEAATAARVVEVYPYAVLRVLWSFYQAGIERPVHALRQGEWVPHLCPTSWKKRPPAYKRVKNRARMARLLKDTVQILDGTWYGRALDGITDDPFSLMRRSELERMTDAFDALLGLVALDAHCRSSPYARSFSVPGHQGAITGLSDPWLWDRWLVAARGVALD